MATSEIGVSLSALMCGYALKLTDPDQRGFRLATIVASLVAVIKDIYDGILGLLTSSKGGRMEHLAIGSYLHQNMKKYSPQNSGE